MVRRITSRSHGPMYLWADGGFDQTGKCRSVSIAVPRLRSYSSDVAVLYIVFPAGGHLLVLTVYSTRV